MNQTDQITFSPTPTYGTIGFTIHAPGNDYVVSGVAFDASLVTLQAAINAAIPVGATVTAALLGANAGGGFTLTYGGTFGNQLLTTVSADQNAGLCIPDLFSLTFTQGGGQSFQVENGPSMLSSVIQDTATAADVQSAIVAGYFLPLFACRDGGGSPTGTTLPYTIISPYFGYVFTVANDTGASAATMNTQSFQAVTASPSTTVPGSELSAGPSGMSAMTGMSGMTVLGCY